MTERVEPSRAALWMADALAASPAEERLRSLGAEPILLAIGRAHAETVAGQLMLVTAANVLGRLFDFAPAIDVHVDADVRVVPGIAGLHAGRRLDAEVVRLLGSLAARPAGYRYRVGAPAPRYLAALMVGDGMPPAAASDVVYIDGVAWVAALGPAPVSASLAGLRARVPAGESPVNPFGALVGAALGAAEIAKCIVRRLAEPGSSVLPPRLEAPVVWNLWNHRFMDDVTSGPSLADLDLGRLAVAGVGAVGSGALWALVHVEGARGTLELVDDDELSETNLERVLIARAADVGRRKVDVGARAIRGTRLRAVRIPGRYDVRPPARARASTILVGVDTGGARRRIMNLLPAALYNGGTYRAEILVSRHVGLAGPCLECMYPEPAVVDEPAKADCGRAPLVENLPEATIGFVAALCGFLVALEVVKDRVVSGGPRRGPLDAERPVLRVDVLGDPPSQDSVEAYVPRRDCFCRDPETRRRYERLHHA